MSDLNELRDRYWRSVEAFIQGDPEPEKLLWSRRDDVTLTNPFRPPAKGWDRVRERMDSAAALLHEGEGLTFEAIALHETVDLAYEVGVQRCRIRVGDADEPVPLTLRVTTIFRREDEGWKIVHRQADPLTDQPPLQSPEQSGAPPRARR